MTGRIVPVILSGGAGTRLWPLSRPERPKQLHAIGGEETMLAATARRVADPAFFAPPMVVAAAAQADSVEAELGRAGAGDARLILEPAARNTAPAAALAALESDSDALLLLLPSDQIVREPAGFVEAVRAAAPFAADGWLVTFGIRPDRAETGYGYIRRGAALAPGAYRAERFVEKPDEEAARAYVEDGGYEWNAGIFLFRAGALLDALSAHAPDILDAVRAAVVRGRRDGQRFHPDATSFAAARSQSIDHAVMEHAERIAVVPVDIGWSDVGSWESMHALGPVDANGNAVAGDAVAVDSSGCLLRSDGPTVVAVGVADLVVVATADAVLVVPRGQSQRVREAVEALEKRRRPAAED